MNQRSRVPSGAIKPHRGFLRLGLVLVMLWFLFWTCAHIIRPQASENSASLIDPQLSSMSDSILLAAAVFGLWWVVEGFWPD